MLRFFAVLLILATGACTPVVRGAGPTVGDPAVVQTEKTVKYLLARDGNALAMRAWLPKADKTAAVVIALHGFNEHGGLFQKPATWWAARGIATYAYDQRGFGANSSAGLWPGNAALISDLEDAVEAARKRHAGAPLYLLGTSMGGAVILAALDKERPGGPALAAKIDGVVLAAPAVWGRAAMNPVYKGLLWLSAHTLPWNKLTGRGLGIRASDNIDMLRALGRDPLVIKQTRTDAVYGVVGMMDAGLAGAAGLQAQALVLYGAHDQIVPPHATEIMLEKLPDPYVYAYYEDGWHMLLHDLQAEVVWRDIAAWIDDRQRPLPSGNAVRKLDK